MSALDRLKNIQSNFKRTWIGIDCQSSGRAGKSPLYTTAIMSSIFSDFYLTDSI